MKRDEFFDVLFKLGACGEGVAAARETKGAVATVARQWAKSKRRSRCRRYFQWLEGVVMCQEGSFCERCHRAIGVPTFESLKRIITKAQAK